MTNMISHFKETYVEQLTIPCFDGILHDKKQLIAVKFGLSLSRLYNRNAFNYLFKV